jgi:hypothetical protein
MFQNRSFRKGFGIVLVFHDHLVTQNVPEIAKHFDEFVFFIARRQPRDRLRSRMKE